MTNDKRAYHRIFYPAEAVIDCAGKTLRCRIVDLSLKGCLLSLDEPWPEAAEQPCRLSLRLTDEVEITMTLQLSHSDGHNAGFKCNHIDIDSITALKRLVELNLGDSRLLERDLSSLAKGY